MTERDIYHCLNCGQSETNMPLVSIRYAGSAIWVCSRCLPILIHEPHQMASKLAGAETFSAASDHHDH